MKWRPAGALDVGFKEIVLLELSIEEVGHDSSSRIGIATEVEAAFIVDYLS